MVTLEDQHCMLTWQTRSRPRMILLCQESERHWCLGIDESIVNLKLVSWSPVSMAKYLNFNLCRLYGKSWNTKFSYQASVTNSSSVKYRGFSSLVHVITVDIFG